MLLCILHLKKPKKQDHNSQKKEEKNKTVGN